MNNDLLERLNALGSHLDAERLYVLDNEIAITAELQHGRGHRWRALAGVAAAVALLVAVLVTINQQRNPDAAGSNEAVPTLFDGGVDLIVWVYAGADPDQVALIRNTLESMTGVLDTGNILYFDHDQTMDEARRVLASDPDSLDLLLASSDQVSSMFKLYALPTTNDQDLVGLAEQLKSVPLVVGTQLVDSSSRVPLTGADVTNTPVTTIAAPETTAAG